MLVTLSYMTVFHSDIGCIAINILIIIIIIIIIII